ncbi:MAG: RsmE family RNA methyltransferase [Acidimicrobiales bacterium]
MSPLEWPRRVAALAQFSVGDVEAPVLVATDEHHLRNVLRAKVGEEVVVTDDQGSWALCEVLEHGLNRVSPVSLDSRPAATTLYLAPLKGDRSEWAVAKATELGISRIVPLVCEHLVVKFKGETREKIVHRWRRIARESGAQSRRTYRVDVAEPVRVRDVPEDVAVADFDGEPDWRGARAVAIGPEGGWGPGEWSTTRRRLSLGPTVLRAETAGIVAASLLAFGAGEWGFSLGPGVNG